MVAMGLVHSWWAVLALPAALLIGFAFGGGLHGADDVHDAAGRTSIRSPSASCRCSCSRRRSSRSPPSRRRLRWVVEVTPLYRGVVLCRELTTGALSWGSAVSVVYLVVMGLVGLVVVRRRLDKLLLT